jgi:hypothetical protein
MIPGRQARRVSSWVDIKAARKALSGPVAVRSLWVAVVVGTVLNVINQGAEIVSGGTINFLKLALTYAVPFCVASYGAYSAFRRMDVIDES